MGTAEFGSSDGNPEPKNDLSRSEGGKGASGVPGERSWQPTGMSRSPVVGWHGLSLGCLGWALRWMLHPSALGLSQFVCSSPSYHTVIYRGASGLFPPAPRLATKPLGATRGDSHGIQTLPWRGGFVNNPAPFEVQQNQVAQNPTLSGCQTFGRTGRWWAASPRPGCSPRDGERTWVVAPSLSIPVPLGGLVT